ncbi:MAG: M1 family metallopeptidase [Saprospirales bacterium]|nr:M1 family metallopeptidase [Saprospirales bacterium]
MRIRSFGLFGGKSWSKSTKNWVSPAIIFLGALFLTSQEGVAQRDFYHNYHFTQTDTLRGMLRPERTCYDVTYYELHLEVTIVRKWIKGYVDIHFTALAPFEVLQVDLYPNMKIKSIEWEGKELSYERRKQAVFITFPLQKAGTESQFRITYEGAPTEAPFAPWQGGFVWSQDSNGSPWVGVACEGDGASLWWPNKDHLSDEPDSMLISVLVPDPLQCISNGNLRSRTPNGRGYTRYDWFVSYPINNYNVTLNIGDYVHFSDTYQAADGTTMPLDYYVLSYNLEKAKKHFQQVKPTLACYERYFGKYPFWNDGYALVETPYLGMEHQSAIAYGNRYLRGYLGGMIPADMDWDYIIVHETGHEYFGNSLGCRDLSEMWIHESFTTYMESLFVECQSGYADAVRYLQGQRVSIGNKEPILGPPDVNWDDWKASDQYAKGAWVLHTLRHAIGNDTIWFSLLKDFYGKYAMQQITTDTIVQFVNQYTGTDYTAFFEQYLWYPHIPVLRYKGEQRGSNVRITYEWAADVPNFSMPVLVKGKDQRRWRIFPVNGKKKSTTLKNCKLEDIRIADELFLISVKKM